MRQHIIRPGHINAVGKVNPDNFKSIYGAIVDHYRSNKFYFPNQHAVSPDQLVDVSCVAQSALDAWLETPTPGVNAYDDRIGHEFGDVDLSGLPFVAEPDVNLLGVYAFGYLIWEVGDKRWSGWAAATVHGGIGPDRVVMPYFVEDDEDVLFTWGVGGAITPALHMLPVSPAPPIADPGDIEDGARVAVMAEMACAVVLIANSIANADPRVVSVQQTPRKVLKQARRKHRACIDKTTTINPPGVRYDGSKWSGRTGDGVAWHMVRGHWRRLDEERRTWVRPHSRGDATLGRTSPIYRVKGN